MILSGYFWSFIDVSEFFIANEVYMPLITLVNGVDLFEDNSSNGLRRSDYQWHEEIPTKPCKRFVGLYTLITIGLEER